jgi:hypothetical protein
MEYISTNTTTFYGYCPELHHTIVYVGFIFPVTIVNAVFGSGNKHMVYGMAKKGQMIEQWTYVRRRSVPFHPTECVELQIRDLVLCFQVRFIF